MGTKVIHWKIATPQDYADIEAFLQNHEPYVVAAASRFIKYRERERDKPLSRRDRMLIGRDETGEMQAFLFRAGHILHPFFLKYDTERDDRVVRRFINLPFSKRILSIQGLQEDVLITEKILEEESYTIQDQFEYYLMHLNAPVNIPERPEGLELVEQPTADLVYPLQAAYEQEEVIPSPRLFYEAQCWRTVERILAEEKLCFATFKGVPTAKANTNATAYRCRQIGGVFVKPEFRGRGIGSYVVASLVERIQHQGFTVTLFVKKENTPAIRIYEKLGFTPIGSYKIAYLE